MKKIWWLIIVILPFLTAFRTKPKSYTTKIFGSIKEIVNGDYSARVDLDTVKFSRRTFGIGLEEKTNAEILIWKGKVYSSTIDKKAITTPEEITTKKNKNARGSFMALARVYKWESFILPSTIRSLTDLQTEIERVLVENNITATSTVPFVLTGSPISANWHVEYDRTLNSQQPDFTGFFFENRIRAVGFYSSTQQEQLSYGSAKIHIHVTNKRKRIIGHLEDIKMAGNMTLWIPKSQQSKKKTGKRKSKK